MQNKISVIGAGSWGTALSIVLANNGHEVSLWCRRPEQAEEVNTSRKNSKYLKDIKIPDSVKATSDKLSATKDASIVVFAVPSEFLRSAAESFSDSIDKNAKIVHVIKGIEKDSGKFMSQVLEEVFNRSVSVLSGPNHAEEVAEMKPTATVIASNNKEDAEFLCKIFTSKTFKAYSHDDVVGVEICSVIKNIIAIAIGVCDGLKLGDNTKSSIITLGLTEMSQVASAFGAKKTTCYGLAGVGDLLATCYSKHSRNRFFGQELGKGRSVDDIKEDMHGMVAEGILNTKFVFELCQKKGFETTLISQAYKVLYEGMNIEEATLDLLNKV